MTDTLTFYHNPMSRARTVHWMLEEIGAPYETKLVDFAQGEHRSPELLAIDPIIERRPAFERYAARCTERPAFARAAEAAAP